ncbi:alpha-2-macroglobulin family protein [Arcticibacter sp. MXS-1]|uniref:alpha-2-macroglobulin family protein n=1 Tax=Arcticibacter sp. MXS-1 TaxID=3341726 RepID=UPI0035A8470D
MDIVVEQYRQIMPPASTETFTLSVKTKSEKVAAELLTTLYDAALDKLTAHAWQIPVSVTTGSYLGSSGSYSITNLLYGGNINGSASLPYFSEAYDSTLDQFLSGRLSGLSITEASGLNEVVVVGYGVQKISATAAGISIRGQNTLQGYSQPLVVLDGKVFERELSTLDPSGISEIMTLKGAEATAIYGQRGAEGVLIISTKGPIVLPSLEVAPVKVRKDFRETAFFYPQLRSDKDGYYRFSFRMPESATEWHWKILAHTSGGNFAYLDRKLQTRLNLMVQSNIPRLLYQGDQIRLQSRISNLDSAITSGKIACRIEDAITGEDLTPLIAPEADEPFTLKGKSTGSASFLLRIPATQLNPLRVTISAAAGGVADAEEHIVPILSPKIFARKTEQLAVKEPSSAAIKSPALPAGSSPCGVSISIEQSPQASLLYALPWLANYSYDCSEQIFNKLRAHVTALNLMRTDTGAQAAYRRAKNALSKEASPKLPLAEANQEGSPWLDLSNKTTKLQEDLTSTLDTTKAKNAIRKHLERLYQSQKTDGGLPWFEGGASNAYITAYVLAGLGQLRQQGWLSDDHQRLTHFVERLLQYTQNELATQTEWQQIYSLYAVSYWLNSYHPSTAQRITIDQILSKAWNEAGEKSLGAQSLLIINSFRYSGSNNELLKERGRKLLGSIRQRAIEDNLYGLRWKEISDSEVIDQSAEETMALIAEALETSGDYNDEPRKMIKWLLSTKQNEHWQSTKATAAAITMLKKENALPFSNTRSMSLIVENKLLEVSDDVMSGVPLAATPLTELPEMVSLKTKGGTLTGAITWYYIGRPSVSEATGGQIKIQKQLSKIDDQLQSHPLDSATWLKPGDHVRIRLVIEANSRLKYVHITDPRAAAFEPKENSSGYRQGKGFTYYQSVRDTGIDIFAETLPRGVSELTYDVVVEQEGTFTSGPTALECMYRPAITAYGNATKINVASK